MAFSPQLKLLVITARNNNSLAFANTTSMKLDNVIRGFSLPNAVALLDHDKALVVTNGGNGTVSIIDPLRHGALAKIDLPSNADNMVVDAKTSKLYVGYGNGGVAVILSLIHI